MADRTERRKVQKMGQSTLVVSLPHDWVCRHGVKAHDPISICIEGDGSLRLSTDPGLSAEPPETLCTINAARCGEKMLLRRLITAAYLQGFDTIVVERLGNDNQGEVWEAQRSLLGLSIVEQDSSKVVLQCLIDSGKYQLPSILDRARAVNGTLYDLFVKAAGGAAVRDDEVQRLVEESDRLFHMASRQILCSQRRPGCCSDIGLRTPVHLIEYYRMAICLELMTGFLASMAVSVRSASGTAAGDGSGLPGRLLELAAAVWKNTGTTLDSVKSMSVTEANRALAACDRARAAISAEHNGLSNGPSTQSNARCQSVLRDLERLVNLTASVARMVFNISLGGELTEENSAYVSV